MMLDDADIARALAVAEEAAGVGAAVVARWQGERAAGSELKGAGDYVTAVDRESEEAIRAFLGRATPEVPVVGEEEGGRRGPTYWAVDPLDGTTNYLLGFPVVAVSVALVHDGRPVAGAVRAPFLGLAFSAARGAGAWAGGASAGGGAGGRNRLSVSGRPLQRAVVAMAYPFRNKALMARYGPALDRVRAEVEDLRRAGAASLDLAWVAAGVFDGYFELNLSEWDVAAGALMVEEAGGVVTDWDGGPGYLRGEILAGSPATHAALLAAAAATPASP